MTPAFLLICLLFCQPWTHLPCSTKLQMVSSPWDHSTFLKNVPSILTFSYGLQKPFLLAKVQSCPKLLTKCLAGSQFPLPLTPSKILHPETLSEQVCGNLWGLLSTRYTYLPSCLVIPLGHISEIGCAHATLFYDFIFAVGFNLCCPCSLLTGWLGGPYAMYHQCCQFHCDAVKDVMGERPQTFTGFCVLSVECW